MLVVWDKVKELWTTIVAAAPAADVPPALSGTTSSRGTTEDRYALENHNHGLPLASGSVPGALAASDFTKLATLGDGIVTSAGAGDTGKTPKLAADGKLDVTVLRGGDLVPTTTFPATTTSVQLTAIDAGVPWPYVTLPTDAGAGIEEAIPVASAAYACKAESFVGTGTVVSQSGGSVTSAIAGVADSSNYILSRLHGRLNTGATLGGASALSGTANLYRGSVARRGGFFATFVIGIETAASFHANGKLFFGLSNTVFWQAGTTNPSLHPQQLGFCMDSTDTDLFVTAGNPSGGGVGVGNTKVNIATGVFPLKSAAAGFALQAWIAAYPFSSQARWAIRRIDTPGTLYTGLFTTMLPGSAILMAPRFVLQNGTANASTISPYFMYQEQPEVR